jgi:sugar phosphate permease
LNQPLPQDVGVALSRPTWVRYQVLGAACTLAVIIYIHRVGFANALPELKRDLGLNYDHLGWLGAAFLIAYGGFEMPWGLAGDRWGARHLLPLILLGWSLVTGLFAVTEFFLVLLGLRFLFGLFQAGAFPIISRMLTDWMTTRERAKGQGLIWMATRAGGLASPYLVGWLILWTGSWQSTLWVLAALGVVWSVAFWPWFRNRPSEMPQVNDAERQLIEHGRAPAASHAGVPWKKILGSRSVWCLCLMYGFGGFAANFYVMLLPVYLHDHRRLSDSDTRLLAALPFLCGAVACLLGGLLSDAIIRTTGNRKWGRRFNGTVGTIVAGIGWLTLHHDDLAMGPAWAACADIGEKYAGTIGGAMNMIGNLLGAVGTAITGYLFKEGRPDLLFMIFAGSFWLATLCWQGVNANDRLTSRPDEAAGAAI